MKKYYREIPTAVQMDVYLLIQIMFLELESIMLVILLWTGIVNVITIDGDQFLLGCVPTFSMAMTQYIILIVYI